MVMQTGWCPTAGSFPPLNSILLENEVNSSVIIKKPVLELLYLYFICPIRQNMDNKGLQFNTIAKYTAELWYKNHIYSDINKHVYQTT